jgi:hypothetical protein
VITSLPGFANAAPAVSATTGYRLVKATLDRQIAAFAQSGAVKNEIDYFRKHIAAVQTPDDLVKDYRLFKVLLSAFGLESQINAQALMKKVLAEDWVDPQSTANKLVDSRYRDLARSIDFYYSKASKLHLPDFVDQLVDRYVTAEFEKSTDATNPGVRLALYFKRMAPNAASWYQIMGDKPLYEVVRTALQIRPAGSESGIDRQAKLLEKRIGLASLKDAKALDRLITRFLANYDQSNAAGGLSAVSLIQPLSRSAAGVSLGASTILGLAALNK